MKNIFKYSPGFLAGVILSSAFAGAAAANSNLITNTIDELWVFVAGDPVLASQVNENFEYLDLGIDENDSRITNLESWPLLGSWSVQLSGDFSESFVMDFTNTDGHYTFSPLSMAGIVFHDMRYDGYWEYHAPITPLWTREESKVFFMGDGGAHKLYVSGRLDVETNIMTGEYYFYAFNAGKGWETLLGTGACVATKL